MNVSKFDITLVTTLTVFVVGGLLMAGMASALVTGCLIGAIYSMDNDNKFFGL